MTARTPIQINGLRIYSESLPSSIATSPKFRIRHRHPVVCNGTIAIRQESLPMLGHEAVGPNLGLLEAITGEPAPIIRLLDEPETPRCFKNAPSPHVYGFIKANRLGLIRHENTYAPKLCAEIASAFPGNSFAIITSNNFRASETLYCLGLHGERNSCEQVTADVQPSWNKRVVVGSPLGMANDSVEFEKRDIILFEDALGALHERSQLALSAPDLRANVFGFIPLNKRLTELQDKKLFATFGHQSTSIAGYGLKRIEVELHPINFPGSPLRCGRRQLKQRGVIVNQERNRFVCDIAINYSEIGKRVLVLTESVEHLAQLAPFLPDWPPLLCSPAKINEYPANIQSRILPYCRFPDGAKCISTTECAMRCEMDVDVVIWASSGQQLPRLNRKMLIAPSESNKKLEFVDFTDRHHPKLRQWSRRRRSHADKLGWIHERTAEEARA